MDTIIHTYETTTSIHWLEFDGKPDESTRTILKGQGWRWSGAAGKWRKAGLLTTLPELPGYTYEEAGTADYSAERAEHYEDRAQRASARADAAHSKADAIADLIPFGQPILVGHHSERRHRRDLDKIHNNMSKAIEESKKANRLHNRAAAAEQHADRKQDAGAIARRLNKMRADYRGYEQWTGEEGERRRAIVAAEIARLEQELEEAGGIEADRIDLQKGDLILIYGSLVEILRVNRKTITGYLAGPQHNLFTRESNYTERTARSCGQHDRTRFQRRIYTAQEWAAVNEGRTQAEAYAVAQAKARQK